MESALEELRLLKHALAQPGGISLGIVRARGFKVAQQATRFQYNYVKKYHVEAMYAINTYTGGDLTEKESAKKDDLQAELQRRLVAL